MADGIPAKIIEVTGPRRIESTVKEYLCLRLNLKGESLTPIIIRGDISAENLENLIDQLHAHD